ncbi:deoxyadenosine kinase [Candidatus Endobugula sertula]|uniref:Deoxyadenosine kinase n=1 Tax=Candidatus Endobugula sertula TaxID=62101 RepID=A0A1D2QTD2_9GAMM|nr:deoxyadenosine kinase [Candidatus Endobugula sertula]
MTSSKTPLPPQFIAIEGAIGVGKTTLAKRLAETFHCDTLLEKAEENPFLERFYQDRARNSLPTQLFFLLQRSQQIQELRQSDIFQPVKVADFLIDKDPLFAEVTLDDDELAIYQQVYNQLTIDAPKPDLVIYLQASINTLMRRIKYRGIHAERTIDSHYLETLSEAYTRFFHFYDDSPLLIVNANEIDWVNKQKSYNQLVNYILSIKQGRHYFNPTSTLL